MRNPAGSLPGTAPGLPRDVGARLARLERANPEWGVALAGVREVLAVLEGPRLATLTRPPAEWRAYDQRPLLAEATFTIGSEVLGELFKRLESALGRNTGLGARRSGLGKGRRLGARHSALGGPAVQVESAIREAEGVSPVARFVAIVVLTQCAAPLAPELDGWMAGFCPVCAAWPVLGETRGLEQARRLRCGRCGTDWRGELLRCVFCGERNHSRLGRLVPETAAGSAAVATCSACGGYLKTVTTLGPLNGAELLLTDFETVELDLAGRQAGFTRPSRLGTPLQITVVEP